MMAGAEAAPGLFGGLAQVGKYFRLISILPATLVVSSVYVLIAGGAPSREPSWSDVAHSVGGIGLRGATALVFTIVIVGMMIHPLQFAATQLLEGYWGPSQLGRTAMFSRAHLHFWRRSDYTKRSWAAMVERDRHLATAKQSTDMDEKERLDVWAMRAHLERVAYQTAANRYPAAPYKVMPTRLGNMLRRYEDMAGRDYGRDALSLTPHLMYLAPPEHRAYVDDARTGLDLAVRFVISWILVATTSFALVWPYEAWVVVPIGAYALAWLSYRAAVHAAEEYGSALVVLFDLNHKILDEYLPVPPPPGTATAVVKDTVP